MFLAWISRRKEYREKIQKKRSVISLLFDNFLKISHTGVLAKMGANASLPRTTQTRITTNLKTMNNQKFQKIKLYGTLTAKELKKHSSRLVGGVETGS